MESRKRQLQLLRETEWMRVYRTATGSVLHESRFEADGLQVPAGSLRQRWDSLTLPEQIEFAAAFSSKPELTREDEEILRFLMERGTEAVIAMIAPLLPKLPDRELALRFLLQWPVSLEDGRAANRYQALEVMGDSRALPFLQEQYRECRRTLAPLSDHTVWELLDYTACLSALWRLDGPSEPAAALEELLTHPDPEVREHAQQCLFENKLQEAGRARRPPAPDQPELVKETEWSRIYCGDNGHCWAVSRFRSDGPEISDEVLRRRWPQLPLEEKIEFALAFCQKPAFTSADLEIVDWLVNEGPEYVRTCVAISLTGRPDREATLSFLLQKIAAPGASFPRYFRVLWPLGGSRMIPVLRPLFDTYRERLAPLEERGIGELSDYIRCLAAMRRAGDWPEDAAAIQLLLQHPDPRVRRDAQRVLAKQAIQP